MRIVEVTLNNYRSWARLSMRTHARLNLLSGPNAQGKSNLLEALYALVTTRPYRAQKDVEVVRFGEEFAHVHADLEAGGRQVSCEIAWQKGVGASRPRKEIKINRQPVQRLVDVFGLARLVLFTPRDLDLVQASPEFRRRYLDVLLCQIYPAHLYALGQYQKVLSERNRWLRSLAASPASRHAASDDALHEAWTEQLVRWGADLVDRRRAALQRLTPHLERIYRTLSGQVDSISLRYVPSVIPEPGETTADALARNLHGHAREERARGLTLFGPHRDDIAIALDGRSMRLYGSQGQMRCTALAMRLAEGEMLQRETEEAPVLLLDDCLSEIDRRRQDALWEYLEGREQVFLTTSTWEADRALPFDGAYYRVAEGRIVPRETDRCIA